MTSQHAAIHLTNNTGTRIIAQMYHKNSSDGAQAFGQIIDSGATADMLYVPFHTGLEWALTLDYWFLVVHVVTGPNSGTYVSGTGSTISNPQWSECQLESADAGQTLTFTVNLTTFAINLKSNSSPVTAPMSRLRDYKHIQNVFVLMLENHSFDNIFAFSGIQGIEAATTSDSNSIGETTYYVKKGAPAAMPTDPGHEFDDVLTQLCGDGVEYSGGTYPQINRTGYAINYATSTTEGPAPVAADIGDIMACFDTPTQLPVMQTLAQNFVLCDSWFSSLPGPTWPNRFFVHGASSGGMDDSPSSPWMAEWEYGDGYSLPNGTIFDRLNAKGLTYRIYNDCAWDISEIEGVLTASAALGPVGIGIAVEEIPANSLYSDNPSSGGGMTGLGWMPQVASLEGISALGVRSMSHFGGDFVSPYDFAYTFIEPHYGDAESGTYQGGSSQHAMDDTYGGEALLKAVYEHLRISPLWYTSLLIVIYDEHGGFYDSKEPPPAPAPADGGDSHNEHGFDFTRYGVRVPALVISPQAPVGVSPSLFDHSSVPKALEYIFGLSYLTARDHAAANPALMCNLTVASGVRTDCPKTLPKPVKTTQVKASPVVDREARAHEPIPEKGNYIGFLQALVKTELELSDGSPESRAAILERARSIRTRGDAREYTRRVGRLIHAARKQRGMHLPAGPAPAVPPVTDR